MTDNNKLGLSLWEKVCRTDPKFTKNFNNGRYSGTDISPQWLIQQATKEFGPMGLDGCWGLNQCKYDIIQLEGPARLLVFYGELWFYRSGSKGVVPVVASTELVSAKGRANTDAHKIVRTDALTKGLSWLGFGADVFMGQFDDASYVSESRRHFADLLESDHKLAAAVELIGKAKDEAALQKLADHGKKVFEGEKLAALDAAVAARLEQLQPKGAA